MVPPVQKSVFLEFGAPSCNEKVKKRRSPSKAASAVTPGLVSRNAARERHRVRSLRNAFASLQRRLPAVPPDTKLSKLDVLVLATSYIAHLAKIIGDDGPRESEYCLPQEDIFETQSFATCEEVKESNWEKSYLHPVRKWPMRSRLYAGVEEAETAAKEDTSLNELYDSALLDFDFTS